MSGTVPPPSRPYPFQVFDINVRRSSYLHSVLMLITLAMGLLLPARMAAGIDKFAIQFDGASTGTGNDARPLSVVFELTGFATPQGVLTIYIGQLALVDAPPEVTELFGPLSQYALDQSMNPGVLDASGVTGQPTHLLFTMARNSDVFATRWDLKLSGDKATLVGTAGKRTFTFVGRIKGYEATGEITEDLPFSTLLIGGGTGLIALIGLGWFWDIRAKKAAAEKLRRHALEGYALEPKISGFDENGRPIILVSNPRMIRKVRQSKLITGAIRVVFILLVLTLLSVDTAWIKNEIREAFLRPMSITMDVPVTFWQTAAVVTPWQLIASTALLAALIIGWLRLGNNIRPLGIKQLAGVLSGLLILFFGLMGHATTIAVLGLSVVIASLLISILATHHRKVLMMLVAGVLLSIPLPESILAAIQGRIGIPPPGSMGFVAAVIESGIGIALALWLCKQYPYIASPAKSSSTRKGLVLLDYASISAVVFTLAVVVSGYTQHRQVQAQSKWMPIAPVQIGRYKTRLVDVDPQFLALVGNPKAKLYEYKAAGASDIVMTVVNGAHLDAYHDPTICMAQGDYVYRGQLATPPGLNVRRLSFASQSRPSHRLILDYWEQDRDGGIETAAKMGRLKHLPNRILKGLRQLVGTPPVVIIRAQVECDGTKACARAENALSNISRNVQTGIR